jgi:hypothetical protein
VEGSPSSRGGSSSVLITASGSSIDTAGVLVNIGPGRFAGSPWTNADHPPSGFCMPSSQSRPRASESDTRAAMSASSASSPTCARTSPNAASTAPVSSLSTIVSLPGWNAQPPVRGAPGLRLSTSGCGSSDCAAISHSRAAVVLASPGRSPAARRALTFAAVHHTGLAKTSKWSPSSSCTPRLSSQATVRSTIGCPAGKPAARSAGSASAVCTVLAFQLPSRFWNVESSASVRAQ